MAGLVRCQSCNRNFNSDKLAYCPTCGSEEPGIPAESASETIAYQESIKGTKSSSRNSWLGSGDGSDNQNFDFGSLVRAQNRTTSAVRAIAIYLLGNVVTAVIDPLLVNAAPVIFPVALNEVN